MTLAETIADESATPFIQQLSLHEVETADEHPSASIIPIWQRYLSDIPDDATDDDPESGYEPDDVASFAQSFADQEVQSSQSTSSLHSVGLQRAKLVDWLKTDENYYIEELFNGNEMAYYRTVADLELCTNWGEAQPVLKDWIRGADVALENADLAHLVDQLQIYFTTNDS